MIEKLFVSAPPATDIRKLLTALRDYGFQTLTAADVAPVGGDVAATLTEAISNSDVVVVVLTARDNLASAIEAGVAVALGKSVVVVADKRVIVPSALSEALLVRGGPGDVEAIQYTLDHIAGRVASPRIEQRRSNKSWLPPRVTLGNRSDALVSQLSQPQMNEKEVLRLLTEAIEASGALVAKSPDSDFGFDLGVWSDELDAIGANPLLIEFTTSFTSSRRRELLTKLRSNPRAQTALVIYMESADERAYKRSNFPLLAISAQELISDLKTSTFPEVVRRLRNQSVHGL